MSLSLYEKYSKLLNCMKKFIVILLTIASVALCLSTASCKKENNPLFDKYPSIPKSELRTVSEVLTPEEFGAVGDGQTDDTEAVRLCFAKAEDQKSVCALTKTYLCSGKIRVYPNTYVYLSGTIKANISDTHGVSLQLFEYDGDNSGYKNRNITIEGGGTLDGRGADETERYNTLLRMGHGENVVIRGITFKNAVRYHAMEITACRNVTVDACKFEGIYAHNDCEYKDKPNHSVINAHEFIQIEELDEGGSGGMTPYDQTVPEDIVISNCEFGKGSGEFYKAIGDHGKRKYSYKNLTIKNNVFYASDLNDAFDLKTNESVNSIIGFYTAVDGLVISGNKFYDSKANAVCFSGNATIENNLFVNVYLSCITILFDSKASIIGNEFSSYARRNDENGENYYCCIRAGNGKTDATVVATITGNKFYNKSPVTNKYVQYVDKTVFRYEMSDNDFKN